jgi:hypothetical protein
MEEKCMHLTNYAINRFSEVGQPGTCSGVMARITS